MARVLFDTGIFSVINTSSAIGVGWLLNFYTANTSTRITTYNAPTGGSANTNPVVAQADGRFPQIWIEDDQDIKWTLTDADGVVKVTVDDFEVTPPPPDVAAGLVNFLAGTSPLPIANGGTASATAANAIAALGGLALPGGTMTGNIVRSTKGVHLYFNTAAMNNGGVYLTVDSDPDPTSAAGEIWLKYT